MPQIITGLIVSLLVSTTFDVGRGLLTKGSKRPRVASPSAPNLNRPRSPSVALENQNPSANPLDVFAEPGGPLTGAFGRRPVGGRIAFSVVDATGKTHLVITVAGAPVVAIDGLYIDNVPASIDVNGYVTSSPWANQAVRVAFYDGTQTTRDSILGAAIPGWSTAHVGRQTAYARITIDPNVTPNPFGAGTPSFTFAVRGHPCFDPRDPDQNFATPSTWGFSENPAIISANYLLHALGAGNDVRFGDIDWPSVISAANTCDEQIELKSGGVFESRYECAVTWRTDERHEDVLERIGRSMGGGTFPVGGKYRVVCARFDAPSDEFTPDCYAGAGLSWADTPPLADRANGARGVFASPAHAYELRDFPVYKDVAALAADGGREAYVDLDLSTVTSHTQAQRLARIEYRKARDGFRATVETKFEKFNTVSDDVIGITDDLADFDGTTFRVLAEETDGFELAFELQHDAAAFYTWTAATDEADFIAEKPIDSNVGGATGSGWSAVFDTAPLLAGGAYTKAEPTYVQSGVTLQPLLLGLWDAPVAGYRHDYQITYSNTQFSPAQAVTLNPPGNAGPFLVEGSTGCRVLLARVGAGAFNTQDIHIDSVTIKYRTVKVATGEATAFRNVTFNVDFTTIDNFSTEAATPYFVLPAAKYPTPVNGAGASINFSVPKVAGVKATTIELMVNSVNNPATATVHASAANGAGGATFNFANLTNTTRYFWARGAAGAVKGPVSNVVAITFN